MKRSLRILLGALCYISLSSSLLFAGNEPPAWLVSRVYAGVGGFSIYGIEAEQDCKPNPGDPYMLCRFDWGALCQWQTARPDANGIVVLENNLPDLAWSRGTGYAHIYFHTDETQTILFRYSHNGIGSFVWLDGHPMSTSEAPNPPNAALSLQGKSPSGGNAIASTDQGNTLAVQLGKEEKPRQAALLATPGWHHLLLKLICQNASGSSLAFSGAFTDLSSAPVQGLTTDVNDPDTKGSVHAVAARLAPVITTSAPFNLAYPGNPLKLMVTLQKVIIPFSRPGTGAQPPLTADLLKSPSPFGAILKVRVTDYSGNTVGEYQQAATFPAMVEFDLGSAYTTGYYGVHLSLASFDGLTIMDYPPDGFSVIAGTAAQNARKAAKKMAVTYYFMGGRSGLFRALFSPYMQRMGIYRNVGGSPGRDLDFYKSASQEGLYMSADFWDHDDPAYTEAYVRETAPYVDSFKSFNEIDIVPEKKKTAAYWVNREKQEYEIVKKIAPSKIVLGGSLVRIGNDPWFLECLRLGLDQWQDVWDVHAYPKQAPLLEGTISNSPNETELGVEMAYKKLGLENKKPFWLGETGARCSHGFDARRWQAETVTKMVAWALSRSDFHVIGFLVPWEYSRAWSGNLGDIEAGHMPAEAAYYTVGALIDGFPYSRLDLGPAVQAALFGKTVIVWAPNAPVQTEIPLPDKGPWVSVDVVGRVSAVTGDKDGKLAVIVTGSPVYFLPQAEYKRLTAFEAGKPAN